MEEMDTNGYRALMTASVATPFPQRSLLSLFYGPTEEKKQRWLGNTVFLSWALKSTDRKTYNIMKQMHIYGA